MPDPNTVGEWETIQDENIYNIQVTIQRDL